MRPGPWLLWGLRIPMILASLTFAVTGLSRAVGTDAPTLPSQFDPYLHRVNGALADPVNLVFLNADPDGAAAAVHEVLGWPVVAGSPMVFYDQDQRNPTLWQLGIDLSRGSRIHMRIEALSSNVEQSYVLAGVHRDDGAACGHVGGAFDEERDLVARAFAADGYSVTAHSRGNTQPAEQCDGSFTEGDGTIIYIDLSRAARRRIAPSEPPALPQPGPSVTGSAVAADRYGRQDGPAALPQD